MRYIKIKTIEYPAFYASDGISFLNLRFENDVKTYGTQATVNTISISIEFENDVKMNNLRQNEPPVR